MKISQTLYIDRFGRLKESKFLGFYWTHKIVEGFKLDFKEAIERNCELWELYIPVYVENTEKK